jgi:hypothetical protein
MRLEVYTSRRIISGWRQSIVATLKANTFGIRFDFYALAQRTGEKQLFIIVVVFFACTFPSSLYFCAVHARAKMDLILFAARTLRGFFRPPLGVCLQADAGGSDIGTASVFVFIKLF